MKRLIAISAVLSCMAIGIGTAAAQTVTVVGSDHDLRTGGAGETTQVCVYCHTPHSADNASAPLWNRNNPTASTFAMYDSPTLNSKTNSGGPQGVSLACLSCHDGATAFDSLINAPGDGTPVTGTMSGSRAVGSDTAELSNDHPISMKYDPVADTGIRTAMNVSLPLFGTNADQVECGTCHNPHDQNTNGSFLRMAVTNSQLCLNCHIK